MTTPVRQLVRRSNIAKAIERELTKIYAAMPEYVGQHVDVTVRVSVTDPDGGVWTIAEDGLVRRDGEPV